MEEWSVDSQENSCLDQVQEHKKPEKNHRKNLDEK